MIRFVSVILLWLAGLGAATQFAKIAIPFALVEQSFQDAGSGVGWLLSVTSLAGALLGIVIGGIIGRLGERRTLITAILLGAAVSYWQTYEISFHAMLFSRFVEGISHLAISVASPVLIVQIAYLRWRSIAMALWSTFFGITFALVAWIVFPIFADGQLNQLFMFHAGYMLAIALLIGLIVPQSPGSEQTQQQNKHSIVAMHLRTYSSPSIAAPGLGWLFYTLTFVSLLALLPSLLHNQGATWLSGLLPLLSICSSFLLVSILSRALPGFVLVVCGFAIALALAVLQFTGVLDTKLFAILLFAALGLVQGASFVSVPELNHDAESQSLAYGFIAQTGNIGNLLGTPILLFALELAGSSALYALLAALYALGMLGHIVFWKMRTSA